jgi:hypothetical protein
MFIHSSGLKTTFHLPIIHARTTSDSIEAFALHFIAVVLQKLAHKKHWNSPRLCSGPWGGSIRGSGY